MLLSKKRTTKALIRLRGCAGWSAPVLFLNPRRHVFSRRGPNNFKMNAMADYGTTCRYSTNSSYCHDISHQTSVQSNIPLGERFCLKNLRLLTSLTSEWNKFSILESLCCLDTYHKVSVQSIIKLWIGYCLRISRWVLWRPSWKAEWNDYCNSESQCGLDTYHKVFNVTYSSEVDVIFTSSGWLPWQSDILNIRKEQF